MPAPTPSGTNVGSSGCFPSKAVATQAMGPTVQQRKKCQLWNPECRLHHLCRDWRNVTILHRRFPRLKVGPVPVMVMSSVHRFCVYAAHLGQVDEFVDWAASICHLKKKKKP